MTTVCNYCGGIIGPAEVPSRWTRELPDGTALDFHDDCGEEIGVTKLDNDEIREEAVVPSRAGESHVIEVTIGDITTVMKAPSVDEVMELYHRYSEDRDDV